ncbi:MAG: ABC transporter ATP-binding protein, partial [Micromonosporaceae bacterium]
MPNPTAIPGASDAPKSQDAEQDVEIEIRDLTMKYGDVVAVDDLTLDIRRGEMLVLLGPSGCGKTSTMRSIVGLETPARGVIRIGGREVFNSATGVDIPSNRRGIGMVFQSYAIWPHKTVFQNVAFPLRMQRLKRAEIKERVEQMLETVGLSGMGPRGASLLSGGQMQRVALARSLVMRPNVLLLDEPLSNLDAKLRDRLRFELKDLQQEIGVTSVYVTHDQGEALALADRVAVMKLGKIMQFGDPISIYDQPNSAFVADFLGVTNLFSGEVRASEAGVSTVRLAAGGLEVQAASEVPVGQDVSVCVRPDALTVSGSESAAGGAQAGGAQAAGGVNRWTGVVQTASFLGTHLRYHINVKDSVSFDVVTFSRGTVFARGDTVTVSADP